PRNRVIIQTANSENWQRGVHDWLGVWCIEIPRLNRVRVSAHGDVKRFLDLCHSSTHVENHPVRMRAGDGQVFRVRKLDHGIIIVSGRTESLCELLGCEVLLVIRTRRVIELLQELRQLSLVSRSQANGKVELLRSRQCAVSNKQARGCGHMSRQSLFRSARQQFW